MSTSTRARVLATALLGLAALAGCAAPSAGGPTAGPAATGAPAGQGTAGPSTGTATSGPTGPAVTKAPPAAPVVDLTLSGWKSLTVAKGTCMLGTRGGVPVAFGFQALEADAPGLGMGLYVNEDSSGYVTVKWLPDAKTGFINIKDIKGAVSADHRSITLDSDLGGGPATEHLKGTITCP